VPALEGSAHLPRCLPGWQHGRRDTKTTRTARTHVCQSNEEKRSYKTCIGAVKVSLCGTWTIHPVRQCDGSPSLLTPPSLLFFLAFPTRRSHAVAGIFFLAFGTSDRRARRCIACLGSDKPYIYMYILSLFPSVPVQSRQIASADST